MCSSPRSRWCLMSTVHGGNFYRVHQEHMPTPCQQQFGKMMYNQQWVIFHIQDYKDSISSPITVAVGKLSDKLVGKLTQDFQDFRGNMSCSSPIEAPISMTDSRSRKRIYKVHISRYSVVLSAGQRRGYEDVGWTIHLDPRCIGAGIEGENKHSAIFFQRGWCSSLQQTVFQAEWKSGHITGPVERSSSPFLQDVSGEPSDQY